MNKLIPLFLISMTIGLFSCTKEDTTGKDLTILCEVMKPFNFEENGVQKGISLDVVRKIMDELKIKSEIGISANWDSIFNQLKTGQNIMAFTTALTPERKSQFQWVGPITLWHAGFVSLKSSGLRFQTIEDAKQHPSIGVVTSYYTGEILLNLGFTNLVYSNTLEELVQNLYNGTVDVVFDNQSLIQIIAQDRSLDASDLDNLLIESTTQGYLAFSNDVSEKVIKNWQEKLDILKDQGFLQELYDTYLPGNQAPGRVTIFTEENPPQNYRDISGKLTGSSIDMLEAMMKGNHIGGPMEITSWTNAYNQITFVPNSMVFSTLRSTDREELFHWVGPLCKKRYCFFVNESSQNHIAAIADAKKLSTVGTVKGWASEMELQDLGFTNLVTFETPQELLGKLKNGDIDCAVLNDISIRILATELGLNANIFRKEAILSEGQTYMAFSKDTDEAYITAWENAYNSLVSSGKLAAIWKEWYPGIDW